MAKSVRKSDWFVDTTWYLVASNNQSVLHLSHNGEVSAQNAPITFHALE